MACVVLSDKYINLDKNTQAYEFLQEINKHYGYDKVVITQDAFITGIFKRKSITKYYIYIKLSDDEYQCIMTFKSLDLQDIECYLLGHLHGLGF